MSLERLDCRRRSLDLKMCRLCWERISSLWIVSLQFSKKSIVLGLKEEEEKEVNQGMKKD